MLANGYIVDTEEPGLGRTQRIAFPLHANGAPAGRAGCSPAHGQHTGEVLAEWVGLGEQELRALRELGAIGG